MSKTSCWPGWCAGRAFDAPFALEPTSLGSRSFRNLIKLTDARLHAESSRNMYSEQGFDALIRAVFGHVCQRLIVESYCTPGSAQPHAASPICFQRSFASYVSQTSWVVRMRVSHLPPASTARMKSSLTRTELFEFWPLMVW